MSGEEGLWIGVLGPLAGTRDGAAVAMPRGRAGVLLAVLAMSAGQPVGVGRLAELIWGERRPEWVRPSIHNLVARVRSVVPGVVVTTPEGYLLDVDPDRVDLLRFRRLVRDAGQAADAGVAAGLLDEALGLWRGEPLSDVRSPGLQRGVVPGLVEEWLLAVQRRAGLDLAGERQDRVIAELGPLTGRYPLREPLWELLIRALAAAGRPAEAIGQYHQARIVLAEELGVDPSAGLQELYQRLLQAGPDEAAGGEPPGAAAVPPGGLSPPGAAAGWPPAGGVGGGAGGPGGVPHQLPADTRVFTGREGELARLLELGEPGDGTGGGTARPGAVVVAVIDGMAGVGKTALAVHAAHRLAARFGDGQLFLDLHGYTHGSPPRTAGQALAVLLGSLGVPPRQIPAGTEERAALYRARLAGTRTLVVLDNAVDEAQVRPLIPGGAGCLVLITSRRKLKALDDGHVVALGVLGEAEAAGLFTAVAGPGRAVAGDAAVAQITRLCGRLPLAVRIAAALLASRPAWSPAYLAGRLRAARGGLEVLSDGDRDVAAVFGLSTQYLGASQRRLYCRLGLAPGPGVDAFAAAALAGTDPAAAERLLQQLVDHSLLLEPSAGRYRMHDLIRAHARALAAAAPPGEEHDAAVIRLLDYYQHTAGRADAQMGPCLGPAPAGGAPAHAPVLADAGAARAWLRAERASLTACLQYATDGGDDDRTVAFSAGLASLLRTDGPWPQAAAVHAAAAAAAGRLGDGGAQARALTELGTVLRLTGDYPGADHSLHQALDLYQQAGNKPGQARALTELGTVRRMADDHPGSEQSMQAALRLYREAGDKPGQASALTGLGSVRYMSGDYPGAKQSLRAALELYQEAGDKFGQAHALTQLIEVQTLTGDYEDAIRNGKAALVIARELGDRLRQANSLSVLGHVQRLTGDWENAARNQKAALVITRELGNRLGQANALAELAAVRRSTGDYPGAARDLEESIGIYQDLGSRGGQALALNYYAAVIADTGDLARAIALYREALRLAREVRHPDDEAIALQGLGESHLRAGKLHDGAGYLRQALEIYQRLGMPAAEHVLARLAEIGTPPPAAVSRC
ncbi:MAG: tetratricopeptide repeat protein [Streptosporangiaceae bacterium]|nr:tetratricopeptide repeat protein [Streptosporangiaceae bacterium]